MAHQQGSSEKNMLDSLCEFAGRFYDALMHKETGEIQDVLFSPLSIYTAVAMTLVGTNGSTKEEVRKALHIAEGLTDTDAHQQICSALVQNVKKSTDKGLILHLANRIFSCRDVAILPEFSQLCQKYYDAGIEVLSGFTDNDAKRDRMNKWVSENTGGKITDLLKYGSVDSDTVCVLINALFFKGYWLQQFSVGDTQTSQFHLLNGNKVDVSLMYQNDDYLFVELPNLKARAIKLPFFASKWNLLVVLPDQIDGLKQLVTAIRQPGTLSSILQQPYRMRNTKLWLPKFKLSEEVSAIEILQALGIHTLFDGHQCNLKKLCNTTQIYVSDVKHKAVFEADEKGAEAAAATAMEKSLDVAFVCASEHVEFRVDHPFFLALVCDQAIPAFVGHVTHPKSN